MMMLDANNSSDDDEEWQPPFRDEDEENNNNDNDDESNARRRSDQIARRTRAHESLAHMNLDEEMERLEKLVPVEWDEMDADYEWFVRTTALSAHTPLETAATAANASATTPLDQSVTGSLGNGNATYDDDALDDDDSDEYVAPTADDEEDVQWDQYHYPVSEREIEHLQEDITVEGLAALKHASPTARRAGAPPATHDSGRPMRSPRKLLLASSPPMPRSSALASSAATASTIDGFVRPRTPRRTTVVRVGSPSVTALAQLHALLKLPLERWQPSRVPATPEAEYEAAREQRRRAEQRTPYSVVWPIPTVERAPLSPTQRAQLAEQVRQAQQLLCQALVLCRHSTSYDTSSDVAALLVQFEVARERATTNTSVLAPPTPTSSETLLLNEMIPRNQIAAMVQMASSHIDLGLVSAALAGANMPYASLVPRVHKTSLFRFAPYDDALLAHATHRFAARPKLLWTTVAQLASQRLLSYRTEKECNYRLRNRLALRAGGPDAAMSAARAAVLDPLTNEEFVALATLEQEHPEWSLRDLSHAAAVRLRQTPFYDALRELLPGRDPLAVPRLFCECLRSRYRNPTGARMRGRPRATVAAAAAAASADSEAAPSGRRRIVPSTHAIDPQTLLAMATGSAIAGAELASTATATAMEEQFETEDLCSASDEAFELEDLYSYGSQSSAAPESPSAALLQSPPKRTIDDVRSEIVKRARTGPPPPTTTTTTTTVEVPVIEEKWTLEEDRAILTAAARSGLLARALQALKESMRSPLARPLFVELPATPTKSLHSADTWLPLIGENTQLARRTAASVGARFDELATKMHQTQQQQQTQK